MALLLVASFVVGLALKPRILVSLGRSIEQATLSRLPFYRAIKLLSRGLVGAKEDGSVCAGIYTNSLGEKHLVYVIERNNSHCCILIPHAPVEFSGPSVLVPLHQVQELQLGVAEASAVLARWGYGFLELGEYGALENVPWS